MFVLECSLCGYKQVIKKRVDKDTYYELTHSKQLWCPCNKCKESHPRIRPKGFVEHGWVISGWSCLLTEQDARYIQPRQQFGYWSKIIDPTIEECYALKRAKELRDIGIQLMKAEKN